MGKKFCAQCGTEMDMEASVCPNCNLTTPVEPEMPKVAAEPAPAAESAPAVTPEPVVVPAKKTFFAKLKDKKWNPKLLIGICAGVVAVIAGIILIIAFTGGEKRIKNMDGSADIAGQYTGEVNVEKVKISGDYSDISEFLNALSNGYIQVWPEQDTVKEYSGEALPVVLNLSETKGKEGNQRTLSISTPGKNIFMEDTLEFGNRLELSEFTFVKGHAQGKFDTPISFGGMKYEAGTLHVEYDLSLKDSSQKKSDYCIQGTVYIRAKVKILGADATYQLSLKVNANY